jgi:phosphoribosylformylglycinamidine synthase
VGGNQSGIPTPQGFVYFDDRYKGKPLVLVGTIGLIPKIVNGKSSVEKCALPQDNIVVVGGRVGRDGIHGATFSSEALNSGSPATAVQIGDPITQKKLSDAIVKEARDRGLYNSITDNGAGGLSCSIAEMAKECGGFEVELEKVPLKYPGLSPWQIWVSESQERMTLAVSDEKLEEFMKLMHSRGVEAVKIGKFNDGNRAVIKLNGQIIFDLDMDFLHNGLPKKILSSDLKLPTQSKAVLPKVEDHKKVFLDMLSRMNIASFDFISYQYDHEVQGSGLVKPLHGKGKVNSNASVISPVFTSQRAVVLSQGLYPAYSEIDPYKMAACSIDTAIRNAIAVGGSVDYMALLDNFCWCDSNNPERLGQLKEASRACYDYSIIYGTPFISGKDSMFNDFKGYDENFERIEISIPPTLLISSIGVIKDKLKCQTLDFKFAGDVIYILGITKDETAASEYFSYLKSANISIDGLGFIPSVDAEKSVKLYRQYESALNKGLIASGISIERGGLAIALAKSSLAGKLGCTVSLANVIQENIDGIDKIDRDDIILYSETQGRFLVSVNKDFVAQFEKEFSDSIISEIGYVMDDNNVVVNGLDGKLLFNLSLDEIDSYYRKTFAEF